VSRGREPGYFSFVLVRLLGALEVEVEGKEVTLPPGKPRSLFAWLAVHRGLHPRRELAGRFWPDVLDSSARASLRSALWALRSALGPAASELEATRERVGLAAAVQTDLAEFRRRLAAGDRAGAVDLAGGRLLGDLDDEWVLEARREHERELSAMLAELAAEADVSQDRVAAVAWARRRLAVDPLSEEAARDLMRLLSAAGDRAGVVTTYDLLRARFRTELGIGPSEETRALARDLGRSDAPGAGRASAGREATDDAAPLGDGHPFTARIAELEALVELWRQARGGHGGVAALSGEGGIGKTRVAAKLIETARAEGAAVAWCAGLDLGGGAPFGLWAELLRGLVRVYGAPPEELPWVADLARLSPELETALGPAPTPRHTSSPQLERVRLFEAMVAMLEWAARRRPCLLLFEDIHTADPASLELIGYVARRLPRLPMLVVLTRRDLPARPDLDSLLHRLPRRGIPFCGIDLAPLAPDEMRNLVRAAARLEPDQLERVVSAADGNPLLALETARAIAAGRADPAESLRGLVRVAAADLHGEARLLAELVSVAGRDVEVAELERLPIADPAEAAGAAIAIGLLVSRSRCLAYRHALLREAFYSEIPEPRRAELHERFAAVLAEQGSSRRAAEVARHFLLAGRDEVAVGHLARAAEDARSVAAYAEAAEFLEQAARIAPEKASLLEELAEIEAWRGRREAALDAFERARAAFANRDQGAQALAWIRRGRWLRGALCYPSQSRAAYLRGLEHLDATVDPPPGARAEALAGLAWAEAVAGDAGRSQELLDRLDENPDPEVAATLDREVARGQLLIRTGRFADSYRPFTRAADLARRIGRPDMSYACLINASVSAACNGEFERSLEFANRCRAIMRETGLAPLEANALAARCHILVRLGRLEEANASAAAEAEIAERLDDPTLSAVADHDRGMACHAAGDHERAAELLGAALRCEPPVSRPLARLARAESLVALDRLDEAEDELRATALEPLGPGDFPDTLVARLARVQGLIALARDDRALAEKRLEEAARSWRRRAAAERPGDSYMAVLADFGRPPVLGLIEPRRELERVESELAALRETQPAATP
jgi:DNA-binding SARP family transcriptional activator/tetratricopeptide (TPR) repeat protein